MRAAVSDHRREVGRRLGLSRVAGCPWAKENAGSAVLETALMMPILLAMLLFAIDFGYLFLVANNVVTASRNGVLYSAQGYPSPAQGTLPSAGTSGSLSDTAGAAGIAAGDLAGLANMSTKTKVQVCSKAIGVTQTSSGYITKCNTYPSGSNQYTPDQDPESNSGLRLQRVDVTYVVTLPVGLNVFSFHTVAPLTIHSHVEMRAVD